METMQTLSAVLQNPLFYLWVTVILTAVCSYSILQELFVR